MLQRILLDECSPSFIKSRTVSALGLPRRIPSLRWPLSGLLASSSSSPPEAAGWGAPRPRSPGRWAAAAGWAAEAAPPAAPGLSVTLCAFSPQRHGYTMKSLKPGLVGMSGGGGSGSPPPPHVALIGVVLMTDTSTRFGESWQKMTGGGGGGGWSAIGTSTPRIIALPRYAAPPAALPEPGLALRSRCPRCSESLALSPAGSWPRTFPGILLCGGQRWSGAARRAPGSGPDPSPGASPPFSLDSQAAEAGSSGRPGLRGQESKTHAAEPPK